MFSGVCRSFRPRVCLPGLPRVTSTLSHAFYILHDTGTCHQYGEPTERGAPGHTDHPAPPLRHLLLTSAVSAGMQEYDLDYDVQEVRLLNHVFKVTTVANEALPLEMLMQLQERR